MNNQTICLNMIVKNEENIIINTLNNIIEKITIHYWVICDTGSTDKTSELIINFFKEKDISGELIHDTWKNFGYNRTKALEYAYNKTDFVFIFDADDRIVGDLILPKLKKNYAYRLQFGNGMQFKRVSLLCNNIKWYYSGVIHEIIDTKQNYFLETINGNYHIAVNVEVSDRNKKGKKKFYNDAQLLIKEWTNKIERRSRIGFYIAECFRFAGKQYWNKSIEWYKKCINEKKQWEQEKYWSCYQLGKLYFELNEYEKSWYYFFYSYNFDTSRREAFYELILKCREEKNFKLGEKIYNMLTPINESDKNNKLFVINHIYDHSLYSEMSIIYFYLNKHQECIKMFKNLFMANYTIPVYINMTSHNLKLYIPHIDKNDREFYNKFIRYAEKFEINPILITKLKKLFIE